MFPFEIDLRTVFLLTTFVTMTMAVMLLFLWRNYRGDSALAIWAVGALLAALGLFGIFLRGTAPLWLSIPLANASITAGHICFLIGVDRIIGRKPWPWPVFAALLLTVIVSLSIFTFVHYNTGARFATQFTVLGLLALAAASHLWDTDDSARQLTHRVSAFIFLVFGITVWIRVVLIPVDAPDPNLFTLTDTHQVVFVVMLLFYAALMYCLPALLFVREIAQRQQSEAELRTSQEDFQCLLAHTLDGFWMVNSDGKLMDVNDVYVQQSGYTREELLGMRISDLEASEAPEQVVSHMQNIVKTGKDRFETLHRRKDKSVWLAEINAIHLPERGGRFMGFIRDISERKQLQYDLQSTVEMLEEAQRTAHIGSWTLNLETGQLVWSNEVFRLFEVDPRQFSATYAGFLDVIHPDDRDMVHQAYSTSLHKRERYEVTHRLLMPDGRIKWVLECCQSSFDATGKALRSWGTVQDITDRVQGNIQLRQSESRLRSIIEHEPECIRVLDREGRLLQMNPAGLTMIEADSMEQVAGRVMFDGIAPEFRDAFVDLHQRVLAGESLSMEFKLLGLKGGERWMETHAVPLEDEGHMVHLAVTRDITERKKAELQLRIAAATFESQEAMMITDANAVILRVNRAFTKITGYTAEDAIGKTPKLLQSGRHTLDFYRHMWQDIKRNGYWQGEIWDRHKDGTVHPKWLTISAVYLKDGAVSHYIGSHFDITDRKEAEVALLELHRDVSQSRQRLREMVAQNAAALEVERKHIAREIHDELGQVLTTLRINLSMLLVNFASLQPDLVNEVRNMKGLVDRALLGVRDVATHLRPPALDLGLIPAIERLCQEFTLTTDIPCLFGDTENELALDDERAIVIYRIVQESLTNVRRYAQASQVTVKLERAGDVLRLEVNDNGVGFDMNAVTPKRSFGLLGMHERAISLAGRLNIASAPGQGTVVTAVIPFSGGSSKELEP